MPDSPNMHTGQALEGPLTATDGNVAVFDGPTGDKVRDGGPMSGGITNDAPVGAVNGSNAVFTFSGPLLTYRDAFGLVTQS